jgi:hypothetical protein
VATQWFLLMLAKKLNIGKVLDAPQIQNEYQNDLLYPEKLEFR